MAKYRLETKKVIAGGAPFKLPCGVIWFSVSAEDPDLASEYTLAGFGDTLTVKRRPFTTPESLPLRSPAGGPDIEITAIVQDHNVAFIR